jgi:hypothetical protein
MFSSKKVAIPVKYRIAISAQPGGFSRVSILTLDGQNESSLVSQKIAKLLLDELK